MKDCIDQKKQIPHFCQQIASHLTCVTLLIPIVEKNEILLDDTAIYLGNLITQYSTYVIFVKDPSKNQQFFDLLIKQNYSHINYNLFLKFNIKTGVNYQIQLEQAVNVIEFIRSQLNLESSYIYENTIKWLMQNKLKI